MSGEPFAVPSGDTHESIPSSTDMLNSLEGSVVLFRVKDVGTLHVPSSPNDVVTVDVDWYVVSGEARIPFRRASRCSARAWFVISRLTSVDSF